MSEQNHESAEIIQLSFYRALVQSQIWLSQQNMSRVLGQLCPKSIWLSHQNMFKHVSCSGKLCPDSTMTESSKHDCVVFWETLSKIHLADLSKHVQTCLRDGTRESSLFHED